MLNEHVKALIQETKQDVKGLGVEFKADLKGCDESLKKEIKDSNTEIKKINTKIAWALGALVGAIFIGGVVINGSLGKIFKIIFRNFCNISFCGDFCFSTYSSTLFSILS